MAYVFIAPGTFVEPYKDQEGRDQRTLSNVLMQGFKAFMEHYVDTVYFVRQGLDNNYEVAHLLVNTKWAGTHCISLSLPSAE